MSTPAPPSYGAPSTPGPTPPGLWDPSVDRPLTEEQYKQWQTRVDRGRAHDKLYHPQWERALKRYAQALVGAPTNDDISALLDYRHVEGSKSALFHRTPEINLIPVDPQDQAIPYNLILPLREKVLNHALGQDQANAKRALHKTLIDTIAASGFMICEIGFEQVTLPTQVMQPGMFGSAPVPTTVQVPVWSRRFVEAVSSKRFVKPAEFKDTDFEKAPWLGVTGTLPIPDARRLGWTLPADFEGTRTPDRETSYDDGGENQDAVDPLCEYTKIYYKASLYDSAVFNPDLYRCLILVKGCEAPAWHRDSPHQTLTPEGQLTDDSMIGNPIHVDTIRDLIDSANVPSDLVVIEKESVELDKFRTTMTRNRRARRNTTLVNDQLGQTKINEIIENAGPIAVPDQYFDGTAAARAMAVVGGQSEPRDNYTAQQIIEHDVELAVGRSPNQGGQYTGKKATATETKVVQANSKARASTDIDRVREYFQRLVRKFDAILQRTMTSQELQKILGQQGALLWEQWRALPGKYAYKIQPDSGRFVDAEEYRAQKVNEYNLLRKDPLINAAELTRQVVTALGYDAGKLVPQDQVPEKPEPAKISLSMSVDNAMALPAEMQLLFVVLETQGYVIPPELKALLLVQADLRQQTMALEAQSPEHGGPATKTERIDKRQESRTGGTEGIGRTGVAA